MIDTCSTTLCNHYGWECTCCRKPDIDPFTHKPIWPDWPGYEWFDRDMYGFREYKGYVGWTEDGGYDIMPNGYFGYWVYLDQPGLWDYKDWEEFRFAITIRNDQTGGYVVWEPIAGGNELTDDGIYLYHYIFKIPDEDVNVGDFYTPIYYDGTVYGGSFDWGMWQQYEVAQIEIGAPYLPSSEFDHETAIISVLYWMADVDGDNCISKNEMWNLV